MLKVCSFSIWFRTAVQAFSVPLYRENWEPSEDASSHLSWIFFFGRDESLSGVLLFLHQESLVCSLDARENYVD